MLNWPIK